MQTFALYEADLAEVQLELLVRLAKVLNLDVSDRELGWFGRLNAEDSLSPVVPSVSTLILHNLVL